MTDRLQEILRCEDLTAAKFASVLGVQPSAISHLLSGRNKPGYDFICRFMMAYPQYNIEWLLLGKPPMLKAELKESEQTTPNPESISVAPATPEPNENDTTESVSSSPATVESKPSIQPQIAQNEAPKAATNPQAPCKVILLYEDSTFESYNNR